MMKPNSSGEPSKRAKRKPEGKGSHAEAREAAATASSTAQYPRMRLERHANGDHFSHRRKEGLKRQRTMSRPSSSPFDSKDVAPNADSEDEDEKDSKIEVVSKIRGAAARNHRAKELRERDSQQQREQERADATGRRKARSERRRGEGWLPPLPNPLSHVQSSWTVLSSNSRLRSLRRAHLPHNLQQRPSTSFTHHP